MTKNSKKNKTSSPVRLASYGMARIYKSNHIKLNGNLLTTLGIRAGDRVEVFLDTQERSIVIKAEMNE